MGWDGISWDFIRLHQSNRIQCNVMGVIKLIYIAILNPIPFQFLYLLEIRFSWILGLPSRGIQWGVPPQENIGIKGSRIYLVGGFNPSENMSHLGWLFPGYGKIWENKTCSKPPTRYDPHRRQYLEIVNCTQLLGTEFISKNGLRFMPRGSACDPCWSINNQQKHFTIWMGHLIAFHGIF